MTDTISEPTPNDELDEAHDFYRGHCGSRRHRSAATTRPRRFARRVSGVAGFAIFLAVKLTVLALLIGVTVSAWRWVFDVLS